MIQQPKVSIITTFYNSVTLGNFVHKAMHSLLSQTYKNIEFICVHDGSPDDTLLHLKEFQKRDSRIIIIDKQNEGTAQYAKAAGQDAATGEYIMLFDHDDEMSADATELAVKTFLKDPELDKVGLIVKVRYDNGKIRNIYSLDKEYESEKNFEYRTLTGQEALQKTVGRYDYHFRGFYKKEVFKSVSFRFSKKLVNADEIVERQILEHVQKIGNCAGIYNHYIFSDSSAKSFNLKKTDLLETDIILRNYFKNLNIYENRKQSFELVAYKNFVNGLKAFHHFEKKLAVDDLNFYYKRLKNSFYAIDKPVVLKSFQGFSKIYNNILLYSFPLIFNYYKFKKIRACDKIAF